MQVGVRRRHRAAGLFASKGVRNLLSMSVPGAKCWTRHGSWCQKSVETSLDAAGTSARATRATKNDGLSHSVQSIVMGLFPTGFGIRFWLLIVATFLGFLGEGTVLPALGPHVRHDLGGSDQTVGFAIGLFSFVSLAARFASGPLADRKGRKAAFLTGLLSCAFAGTACLLPLGLAAIYLGRTLQGFGEAFLYTGAAAWAVEVAGIRRSGQALGYISCGIWGGTAAGPVPATGTVKSRMLRPKALRPARPR